MQMIPLKAVLFPFTTLSTIGVVPFFALKNIPSYEGGAKKNVQANTNILKMEKVSEEHSIFSEDFPVELKNSLVKSALENSRETLKEGMEAGDKFSPLESIRKSKNKEYPSVRDDSKNIEEDKNLSRDPRYIKFVKDLGNIVGEDIYTDREIAQKGIEKIEVLSPFGKFPVKKYNHLISIVESSGIKNSLVSELESSLKNYLISVGSDSSREAERIDGEENEYMRKTMKQVFSFFFNYEGNVIEDLQNEKEIVKTYYLTRPAFEGGHQKTNLLFFREYQSNYYYLKITFNVPWARNKLQVGSLIAPPQGGENESKFSSLSS